ncbi:Metallo-hydrolase/oxidoreductase [Paraphaeosphaeria sporulosa]|uniref:Metallo-hydrolase/oxidoreductase n=1 Tax=Paraphaeosphaeria sporulosa TaxID=1460663 RepID=A0A177CGS4_9PLEO|nr:Metallo-hydrolase/oxidoreductase [Paraphaeosphaeria sporulosa]OAG06152.1 Metallo-hydrolase/oxidoreductase [Paraphaeosphaeria sporulosa]
MDHLPLKISVTRNTNERTPKHHVVIKPSPWTSVFTPWTSTPIKEKAIRKRSRSRENLQSGTDRIASFENPWPSFHKPTRQELWDSLAFGADEDPCIELAASHAPEVLADGSSRAMRDKQAAQLLRIETPDFSFDGDKHRSKSTWLGHASMLLQLPSLGIGGSPTRVLFDPIFSMRCSPSQSVGPIRSYFPPCKLEELPPIDVVLISHNHYDHLDCETIKGLWKLHSSTIRFVVPLKNKKWFTECGVPADRVEELDWWESAVLSGAESSDPQLQITCTPAQHGSGREGGDANTTLWSSWYLERSAAHGNPYRVFFAGDTGYQFHSDPSWPPRPPATAPKIGPGQSTGPKRPMSKRAHSKERDSLSTEYPACPAFAEIAMRLGQPHLLYLPLALGATWAYLKSFFSNYLPDSLDPFPRHSPGIAGAIHMPPWDAVRVLREMTDNTAGDIKSDRPIAIGMHWGTFVTDQTEVLKTLGQLEWACSQQDVEFSRSLEGKRENDEQRVRFLALNHGQSVTI